MIGLKFSDVIMAAASIVLVTMLLDFVLKGVFIPLNSTTVEMLAWGIASFVGPLIVGYVFALKIQEEPRIRAIGGIVVLSTFMLMLFVMVWFANPLAHPWIKDTLERLFNTGGWTSYEWSAYTALAVALDVGIALILTFAGLNISCMLRKPKKTRE